MDGSWTSRGDAEPVAAGIEEGATAQLRAPIRISALVGYCATSSRHPGTCEKSISACPIPRKVARISASE